MSPPHRRGAGHGKPPDVVVFNINKNEHRSRLLAEREGFEPSRRFPAYTLSRRAPSTTRPPLRRRTGCHVAGPTASPANSARSRGSAGPPPPVAGPAEAPCRSDQGLVHAMFMECARPSGPPDRPRKKFPTVPRAEHHAERQRFQPAPAPRAGRRARRASAAPGRAAPPPAPGRRRGAGAGPAAGRWRGGAGSRRGGRRHRRRLERPCCPAAEGLRLHAPVVTDVPVPLVAQVVHRPARRVRDRRPGQEAGRKARGLRPPAPVHVLGDREAGEAADRGEDRAAHREVRGGGEVVAGDGQLLAETVDEVEGLGRVGAAGHLGEDPDRAAEDARTRIGGEGGEDRREPAGIGDAVGVEEGEDIRPRQRDAAVARRPRPRLRLEARCTPGRLETTCVGSGVEPLSTTRTSKRSGREGLLPEGVEAGGEQARLVEMRNDDADLRDRGAVDRRCPEKPSPRDVHAAPGRRRTRRRGGRKA